MPQPSEPHNAKYGRIRPKARRLRLVEDLAHAEVFSTCVDECNSSALCVREFDGVSVIFRMRRYDGANGTSRVSVELSSKLDDG